MTGFIVLFDTGHEYNLLFNITHTHTSIHSHVFTACRCLEAASNGGLTPSSEAPELSPATFTSLSQQQRTTIEPQRLSN
jgi:hypothetical protein